VLKGLCWKCKDTKAGKYRNISFIYLGLSVTIFKDGLTCIACAKEEWIKDFEESAKGFISLVNDKPKVDWPHYHEHFAMGRFHDQKKKVHSLLIDLGILSPQPKGNWDIVADGPIGLNPRAFLSYLYFTQKEDAVEFARLEKDDTMYNWEIHQIAEVISKDKVIKKSR